MDITNERIRPSVAMNMLLTIAIAVFRLTPIVNRNVPALYYIAIFITWLLSSINLPKGRKIQGLNFLLVPWLAFIIWQLLLRVLGHSSISYVNLVMRATFYAIPMMLGIVITCYNKKEIRLLLSLFFIVVFLNVLSNIQILIQDPDLLRRLSYVDSDDWKFINLGKTSFIAMCLFYISYCFIIMRGTKIKSVKFIALAALLLTGYYISFLNTRGTAVGLGLLMIALLLSVPSVTTANKSLKPLYYFFGALLVILLFRESSAIFGVFEDLFSENNRMLTRITDFQTLATGGTEDLTEGSLATRILLYQTSLKTFFSSIPNFILGVGDILENADDLSVLLRVGIGGHSEFFDALAKFGIIGAFFYYWIISSFLKYFKQLSVYKYGYSIWRITFVIFVIYSLINTSFKPEVIFLIFFAIPLIIYYFYNEKEDESHV